MKKLLSTSALCLVFATGFGSLASANETATSIVFDAQEFTEVSIKQNALVVETSLYRGDFQQIARSAPTTDMYAGMGSSTMVSVVALRY